MVSLNFLNIKCLVIHLISLTRIDSSSLICDQGLTHDVVWVDCSIFSFSSLLELTYGFGPSYYISVGR